MGLAVGVIAVHGLPKTYRAGALLYAAPQRSSDGVVRRAGIDALSTRIQLLRECVTSTPALMRIIDKLIGQPSAGGGIERLINETRSRIEVKLIGIETVNGERAGGTIRLGYWDPSAGRAAEIVNGLVHYYEETQTAGKLEVIERATPPSIPLRPIPAMIYAVGVLAGLLVFVGPLLAKALLDPMISSRAGLLQALEVPVLVSIPRVATDEVLQAARGRRLRNVLVSLASIAVLIVTVVVCR